MSRPFKILAVDDDPTWLEQIPIILEGQGQVYTAATISEAISRLENEIFDLVLLDLNFDDDSRTGLDVFQNILTLDAMVDVTVVSAETRIEKVVEVCNAGVSKFVPKPVSPQKLRDEVAAVLSLRATRIASLRAKQKFSPLEPIVGESEKLLFAKEELIRIAKQGVADILLIGETGTGKELFARAFSQLVDPCARLLPLNCGAISDSLGESELFGHVKGAYTGATRDRASIFEMAAGGCVFLDEIGEMSAVHQTKLLRVLQERKVTRLGDSRERSCSFRTISATHVDLPKAVAEGKFREDIYYRLSKAVIRIPPLRERLEDIPMIVTQHRKNLSNSREFSLGAIEALSSYDWPGNVRQLLAIVEALALNGEKDVVKEAEVKRILARQIVRRTVKPSSFLGSLASEVISKERQRFTVAIRDAGGKKQDAAKRLGISRATFYRRMNDLGLN